MIRSANLLVACPQILGPALLGHVFRPFDPIALRRAIGCILRLIPHSSF
jgi:hypothetical protein